MRARLDGVVDITGFFCVRTLAGRLAYYRPAGAGFAPR